MSEATPIIPVILSGGSGTNVPAFAVVLDP